MSMVSGGSGTGSGTQGSGALTVGQAAQFNYLAYQITAVNNNGQPVYARGTALYKTEVIYHRGPWRNLEEVEYAALEWTGSTTAGCSNPSGTFRLRNSKCSTFCSKPSRPSRPDSNAGVSGIPGAVQP